MNAQMQTITPESLREYFLSVLREVTIDPSGDGATGKLDQLRMLLPVMPLTTSECSTCLDRVLNANRLISHGKPGAARYQLRMLQRSFRNEKTNLPSRRNHHHAKTNWV